MHRIVSFIFISTLILTISACGKKDGSAGTPIIGTWKVVETSGTAADVNKDMTYEFREDGKLMVAGIRQFDWSLTNDTLYWNMGKAFKFSATFKISGDTMHLDFKTSNQKFVMKKQ